MARLVKSLDNDDNHEGLGERIRRLLAVKGDFDYDAVAKRYAQLQLVKSRAGGGSVLFEYYTLRELQVRGDT